MDGDDVKLDQLQAAYKAAVDVWVAAIRAEEDLASVNLNPAVDFDSRAGFCVRHNHCEQLRLTQGAAADRADAP